MSLSYEELLNQLAENVGLDAQNLLTAEELIVDELNIGLQLDGDMHDGDIVFFAMLGVPAEDIFAPLARLLLEANNFWVGTGGCTLGLQQGTGAVTICARLPIHTLTGDALAVVLDAFVDTALFWKAYVEGSPESSPAAFPAMQLHTGIRG